MLGLIITTIVFNIARPDFINRGLEIIINDPQVQQELGITQQQVETLRKIRTKYAKEFVNLRNKIELIQIDIRDEASKENPDITKLQNLVEQKHKYLAKMEVLRLKELIEIKKVLNPEQVNSLKKILRKRLLRKRRFKK